MAFLLPNPRARNGESSCATPGYCVGLLGFGWLRCYPYLDLI
jgi:hypothetical protein